MTGLGTLNDSGFLDGSIAPGEELVNEGVIVPASLDVILRAFHGGTLIATDLTTGNHVVQLLAGSSIIAEIAISSDRTMGTQDHNRHAGLRIPRGSQLRYRMVPRSTSFGFIWYTFVGELVLPGT